MENRFVIKDNQGRYEGHIDISSASIASVKPYKWEWAYTSQTYPMSGSTIKYNAELKIQKLRELNSLAGYSLDWKIVELTEEEHLALLHKQHAENELLGRDQLLTNHYNTSVVWRDIPKGKLTAYRKAVNDIYKKYKSMAKKRVA